MLNEYLAYDLLMEELVKRNYAISKIEKDQNWKGGNLVVPFRGARASSYKYGGLTDLTDISEYNFVRGSVSGYKEIWGTLKWNARDLMEHNGKVSEQSFLKNLPDMLEDFIDGMKDTVSQNLLTGGAFATLTANGTAGGLITVDRPERFNIGQKVIVQNTTPATVTGFVKTIDINTAIVHLVTVRGGAVDLDCSAMTTALTAQCYVDGAQTAGNPFTSLRGALLSAANGGDTTLYGQTKTDYPYLQSINFPGSTMTASTVLNVVFDGWTRYKQRGKSSDAAEVLMSYKHLGNVMKQLESQSGAFKNVETKVNVFGYTEITVVGVKGALKIIGVHEMDDDIIMFVDWKAIKLHSNGFFQKQTTPEGLAYYTVRDDTNGYSYIVDVKFYGEMCVHQPTACGVIYGINY